MVQINNITVQDVLKNIEEASVEGIANFIKVDYQKLVIEAKKFINSYEMLEQQKDIFSKEMLIQSILANPASAITKLSTRASKETYILRTQYLLAIKFEEYLDKFRENQLPRQALYVITDSEGKPLTFTLSMQELIMKADRDGRLNISSINTLRKQGKQALEEQKFFLPDDHIAEAQAAFEGTTNRLQQYYNKVKKSGSNAQSGILLWKEKNQWVHGRVLNQGDLKEAYVSFLLDTHQKSLVCNYAIGNKSYYDHDFIGAFFDNYINKVTNKAAIFEEDVHDNLYQYGVKSKKSELPGINQYLTTAKWIISQPSAFTKEEIEAFLTAQFPQKAERNIRLSLEKIGEKSEIEIIKDLEKILNKT